MKKRATRWFRLFALLVPASAAFAGDFASLRADRAAIERIYYNHRLGDKPPFEQALPPATLENLIREDLRKAAVLKQKYGVEVTPVMLDAEVQRITTTTRAPEVLAEIKAALGNDTVRFANSFARPILVERLLRAKFDNDDALHAPERRQVEQARNQLLAAMTNGADWERLLGLLRSGHPNEVTETTFQLGEHAAETNGPVVAEMEIRKRFGPNAQILTSPVKGGRDAKVYFSDLPEELQNLLRVQLQRSRDISAVVETPGGFLLFLAKERTGTVLNVAALSLAKRSYELWLADQANEQP